MELLDLSHICMGGDKVETLIQVMTEGYHWETWLKLGVISIDRRNHSHSISSKLKGGTTDIEHSPCHAASFNVIGLEFDRMYNGESWFYAYIETFRGFVQFNVPASNEYNPIEDAESCDECGNHLITDKYLPPDNKKLYRSLSGQQIRIIVRPL